MARESRAAYRAAATVFVIPSEVDESLTVCLCYLKGSRDLSTSLEMTILWLKRLVF